MYTRAVLSIARLWSDSFFSCSVGFCTAYFVLSTAFSSRSPVCVYIYMSVEDIICLKYCSVHVFGDAALHVFFFKRSFRFSLHSVPYDTVNAAVFRSDDKLDFVCYIV